MAKAAKILLIAAFLLFAQSANAEWVRQKTSSFSWLHDVFFVSESKGWIVGSDGTILSTVDGGLTWTPTKRTSTDAILQVYFTDENTGWLLCERDVYSRGQNAISYLKKTTDGGRNWATVEFDNAGRGRVTRLAFNRLGWGTAFGEGGVFYKLQEDGKTWKKNPSTNHYLLLSGSFSDAGTGALAGAGGTIMFTEDNGLVWEKATLIGNADARLNSIFFASQRLGWAVGANGVVLACSGGGRLWRGQESGTTADLNDVYFIDSQEGWAVGDNGVMLHTRNGGASWREVNSNVKHRLDRVYFFGRHGWIVGYGGTVLSYESADENRQAGRPQLSNSEQ